MTRLQDTATLNANVEVSLHDANTLLEKYPHWDSFSPSEKQQRALSTVDALLDRQWYKNTTTRDYHENVARVLDGVADHTPARARYLALGDGTSIPSIDDSELDTEFDRIPISEFETDERTLVTSTFIDHGSANGESLLEAGLVTREDTGASDHLLINRVLIEDPEGRLDPKTSEVAVTIRVFIGMSDISEV